MNEFDLKKQAIAKALADYLLVHGMKSASLRQLAVAVGTSDRMLLHYFTNKEELLTATLHIIEVNMLSLLESAKPNKMNAQELILFLSDLRTDSRVRPYMKIGLELAASSSNGEIYYRAIAKKMMENFYNWIASVLDDEDLDKRKRLASFALAIIEGFVFLDAVDAEENIVSARDCLKELFL